MGGNSRKTEFCRGDKVFVNQAFECCPYAAIITSKIHDFLELNGYQICDEPEDAHALVINTCGLNTTRTDQAVAAIRHFKERARGCPIVVCGCLTKTDRRKVGQALKGRRRTVMIGPGEHERFDKIFSSGSVKFCCVRTNLYKERYSRNDPRLGLYHVHVSTGCMNECKYCVIRKAKERLESRPIPDIMDDVRRGIKLGHRDIFLVGDDLSCYGLDLEGECNIAHLLDALTKIGDECRFSCEAFEPSRFIQRLDLLLQSFGTGRLSWIDIPVQSGSNRIIELMGRNYTRQQVEDTIKKLRAAAPDLIISTDFIICYPGETMDDFNASLSLAGLFDHSCFNVYEQMPGTPAVDIAPEELELRKQMVFDYQQKRKSQFQILAKNRLSSSETRKGSIEDRTGQKELSGWIRDTAAGLKEIFEERRWKLAEPWKLERINEESDGVLLVAVNGKTKKTMKLLVTKRDEKASCMAFSDEYNWSLITSEKVPVADEDAAAALGSLISLLGLKQA